MSSRPLITPEEKQELLCNPYTLRVTDHHVFFTLEFKQFVLENIEKPGMNSSKVFKMAGYRKEMFPKGAFTKYVLRFKAEASSPEGLRADKTPKRAKAEKKTYKTEIKDLQERIELLEQQVDFLKKTQLIRQAKDKT